MSDFPPRVRPQLASHVRLKIDPVTNEPVLLFPEGLLVLNHTAHEIVSRCNGQNTLEEIVGQLATEFAADEATLRADVIENLTELQQRNLLLFKT